MGTLQTLTCIVLIGIFFGFHSTHGFVRTRVDDATIPNTDWGHYKHKNLEIQSKSRRYFHFQFSNASFFLAFNRLSDGKLDGSGFPSVKVNLTIGNNRNVVNGSYFNGTKLRPGESIIIATLRQEAERGSESTDRRDRRILKNPELNLDIQVVRALPTRLLPGLTPIRALYQRALKLNPSPSVACWVQTNQNANSKLNILSNLLGWLYAIFWIAELIMKLKYINNSLFLFRGAGVYLRQFHVFTCYGLANYYFYWDSSVRGEYYGRYPDNVGNLIPVVGSFDLVYCTFGYITFGMIVYYGICEMRAEKELQSKVETYESLDSTTLKLSFGVILCALVSYFAGITSWFVFLISLLMMKLVAHIVSGACLMCSALPTQLEIIPLIWTLVLSMLGGFCLYFQVVFYMMGHSNCDFFTGDGVKIGLSVTEVVVSAVLLVRIFLQMSRKKRNELLKHRENLLREFEEQYFSGKVIAAVRTLSKLEATFSKLEKMKTPSMVKALSVFAGKLRAFRTELWGKLVMMDKGKLQLRLIDLTEAHKMGTECLKLLNGLPGKLYKNTNVRSELYALFAIIAQQRGYGALAYQNCKMALEYNAKNEKALLLLGYIYFCRKHFYAAIAEYKKALLICKPGMIVAIRYLIDLNTKALKESTLWTSDMQAQWEKCEKKLITYYGDGGKVNKEKVAHTEVEVPKNEISESGGMP